MSSCSSTQSTHMGIRNKKRSKPSGTQFREKKCTTDKQLSHFFEHNIMHEMKQDNIAFMFVSLCCFVACYVALLLSIGFLSK